MLRASIIILLFDVPRPVENRVRLLRGSRRKVPLLLLCFQDAGPHVASHTAAISLVDSATLYPACRQGKTLFQIAPVTAIFVAE